MNSFEFAFENVIGSEGGFQDDKHDRGNWTTGIVGKGQLKGTKYGISAMSYPTLDIKNITVADAKHIYLRDYWDRVGCNRLPYGLDYMIFDISVNHGRSDAGVFLQTAVGATRDGKIGPKTLELVHSKDTRETILKVKDVRENDYRSLKTFSRYGDGWLRRNEEVTEKALGLYEENTQATLDQSKVEEDDPAVLDFWAKIWRRI